MINVVRWKHNSANVISQKNNIGAIYEKDMVITQFGFVGYVFSASEHIGLHLTHKEKKAFNHMWRVVGYMLGIPDQYVCIYV